MGIVGRDNRGSGMKSILVAASLCMMAVTGVQAGPIDQACARSNGAANMGLCACIQQVANMTLTGSDQKMAAKFFSDPSKAQEVRQSSRSGHREFWQRYVAFGSTAESVCAK